VDVEWIGQDGALREAIARLVLAARTPMPVLVLGETGTGKELAARTVHQASNVARGPWVALNCGALPEPLIESELFGAARGAFTGAVTAREGLVEAAEGGTLFLDEIGDAAPSLQMKLLRLLDQGEFRRVGETRMRHARVRVIAATHRDLARWAARGRFRADLWYRLAAVEVTLPPLRTRGDDVFLLARAFLERARAGASIDPGARKAIGAYAWPGNVRELAQAMVHAALFAESPRIEARHLPARVVQGAAVGGETGLKGEMRRIERARIDRAIAEAGGNHAKAARRLGLSRQGLWLKLRRMGER